MAAATTLSVGDKAIPCGKVREEIAVPRSPTASRCAGSNRVSVSHLSTVTGTPSTLGTKLALTPGIDFVPARKESALAMGFTITRASSLRQVSPAQSVRKINGG